VDKRNLKLIRKKPYMIRQSGPTAVLTMPAGYLALAGLSLGDKVFLYLDGKDMLISKNQYLEP